MNPHKTRPSRFFRSPLPLSLSLSLLIVGLLSATVIPPEELEANKPRILQTKSGNSLLLDWAAQPEVYYFMEASPDLSTWASAKLLKDNAETGTLSLGTTISSDKAFFRLSLEGDPSSARLRADDDGDKIINLLEADADMDAFKTEASVDSDGDEIPDYWEQFHFGTLVHDASYVAITDGLTLAEAFAASTDPTKLNSDGDGWSDALELIWGWDPNYDQGRDDDKYSYLGDFDGDGINNGTELLNETNASDSADAPPSPPKFAVIDLGEVSDNQIKDLANNGWTLIRKNNGDFHRWHWGIEEALSPSIEDSHCAAINSSGIVVGEAEDLTSEAWIYNAVYWPTNSSSYTILPPANPDEDNGIWQGIHDITDSNKIGGRGFLQLSGVNTGSGMTGQLETGFDHELGSLSRGGSPDYKLNGISYAPDKINDQGSFIGIQRVYQNSSMIEYNAAVSVISGGSPRIHEQVYDINESDMVLAKDVSSPEGALLLADGTRVDLDLWDGEELSAMSSPSNPTDPLIIITNWSIYIQKQIAATDGSASLAPIVDKSSFYIYDIWDIFPSSDYYSTSGKQLISPDGTMIATPIYHAPTGETRQLLLLKVDVEWQTFDGKTVDEDDNDQLENFTVPDDYNDYTSKDLSWLEGLRYFAGGENQNATSLRNIMKVKVRVPGASGLEVKLKAFDVDDKTSAEFDPSGEIDDNDTAGDDNLDDLDGSIVGVFVSSADPLGSRESTVTLDDDGEAEVFFRVSPVPGSNYRIAAELQIIGQTSKLGDLQVAAEGETYVSADNEPVTALHSGAVSKILTVWRKLHIEVDSMDPGPPSSGDEANYIEGVIANISGNNVDIGVYVDGYAQDEFNNGRLVIDGKPEYDDDGFAYYSVTSFSPGHVPSHPSDPGETTNLNVSRAPDVSDEGKSFKLYDDDDTYLSKVDLPSSLPKDDESDTFIDAIKPKYAPAFIEVMNANTMELNTDKRVEFKLNEKVIGAGNVSHFDNAQDLSDSTYFWAHTLVFGYQPQADNDYDPSDGDPLYGGTPKTGLFNNQSAGYSVVYTEMFREYAFHPKPTSASLSNPAAINLYQKLYWEWALGTAAHEIGHSPGQQWESTDHSENGLMYEGGATIQHDFSSSSLKRFRSTSSWSQ